MAITPDNIKLMQPERLTDNEDGGGQMTGLPVIDGDINNLFEDISRVNRAYGSVSLRKAFLKVDTDTADLYLDAHTILSAQPEDPNVSGLIFNTNDFYDERSEARQRVESFVIQGPVTGLHLRGNQLQGQQALIIYAPSINRVPAPEIGETYMLQINEDENTRQFIKVLDIEESRETFTYQVANGDIRTFNADQYVLQLSAPLARDYPAGDPNPKPNNQSRVFSTQAAPAAKYYGTTTLTEAATAGTTTVRVADTFAPIIPTASSETAVIDQRPGGLLSQIVPITDQVLSLSVSVSSGTSTQLPTSWVPGTLSLTIAGTTYTDRGTQLLNESGEPGQLEGTTVDRFTGQIDWQGAVSGTGTISWQPGILRQQLPHTGRIDIDDTNRNFNYVLALDPVPAPGTFVAAYQYLGKWYELADDGSGNLVGDGSGQINLDTGSVILTLQAQPDASSVIFYRWTEPGIYAQTAAEAYNGSPIVNLQADHQDLVPGTVVLTWTADGLAKTANDTGTPGQITGDATGQVDYSSGRVQFTSPTEPDAGTEWGLAYDYTTDGQLSETRVIPENTNRADVTFTIAPDIKPGTVRFPLRKAIKREVFSETGIKISENYRTQTHWIRDNGEGNLIDTRGSTVVGTVNYTTGAVLVYGNQFLLELNAPE